MDEHAPSAVEGLYRDAGKLVVQEGAVFPDRCVICNREADAEPIDLIFERKKSHYVEAWAVQSIAMAATDLVTGAKYTGPVQVTFPFCSAHRNKRLWRCCIGGGLMALGAGYLLVRYLRGAHRFDDLVFSLESVIAFFVGVVGIGITVEAAFDPARVWFRTKKFYDRYVWLEGAGREFLSTLPALTGRSTNPKPAAPDAPAAGREVEQRPGSKKRDVGRTVRRTGPVNNEDNLSAEELIRRARLAGVDDEDD